MHHLFNIANYHSHHFWAGYPRSNPSTTFMRNWPFPICIWSKVQKTKVCIPYQWYLRLIIWILWVTVCNTIKNTTICSIQNSNDAISNKFEKCLARGLPRMFLFTFIFHPLWRTNLWRKLQNQLNVVSICNLFQVRSDYLGASETTFIPRNIFVILFLGSTYIPNLYIILYHKILFSANGHRLVKVLVSVEFDGRYHS